MNYRKYGHKKHKRHKMDYQKRASSDTDQLLYFCVLCALTYRDVENGRRVRPVIVPDNTGIPYILYIRTSAIHLWLINLL
jgi:hypothetical protein